MRTPRGVAAMLLMMLVVTAGCLEPATDPPRGPTPSPGLGEPVAATGNVTVEFLDVGQGDATMVHAGNATMLVDAGNWYGDSEAAVLDHLRRDGIERLDLLVVTHPDADHAGACSEVLGAVHVVTVVHPGSSKDTETWRDCAQGIEGEGARVLTDADLDPGSTLPLPGGLGVTVLHVDAGAEDVNAGSVALHLRWGGFHLVLPGDVPCRVEDAILDRFPGLDADVLLVGHHGSRTSTCTPWLEALTPQVGVVSSGAGDPYGHPHEEVMDRLRGHGVRVLLTEEVGTVTVTSDGTGFDVATQQDAPPKKGSGDDATSPWDGSVVLGEVRYDAPGNDNDALNEEWVEVVNRGNRSVDLAGWTLEDEADHVYAFPGNATLAPNASLQVHTGSGNDTAAHLYWGRAGAVWNNGGDVATLRDAEARLVDQVGWKNK